MPVNNDEKWKRLFMNGYDEGFKAARAHTPQPMTVLTTVGSFCDKNPKGNEYVVPDGLCGFASVIVKPGNSSFAKWLKNEGLAEKHYYGGVYIWISDHNQSYERKKVHANKMAEIFQLAGIAAHAESRLD